MADRNRRMVLAERPSGMVDERTVRLEESDVPVPGDGEALARVRYLSIDPTIRTWMDDAPGYLPPIALDEVIRSGGVAEVISSNTDEYEAGQLLFGFTGWQDYVLASSANGYRALPPGVPPTLALSLFGVTGMTAYFGLIDVGRVKEGDVVVVSGAAGATGSTVGQIAKIKGAKKVIGIAGGPQKCAQSSTSSASTRRSTTRATTSPSALHEAAPDGIDLYFDNVGGEILDACLAQLALRGRIVLCGAISGYNDRGAARTGELRQPDHQARAHGGLFDPRLLRPARRGPRRDRALARRRQDQVLRARRRGPRACAGRAQPAVHRGQHRQGHRPSRVEGVWAARSGVLGRSRA